MTEDITFVVVINILMVIAFVVINYKLYQYFAKKNIDLSNIIKTQKDTIKNLYNEINDLKKQLEFAKKIDIKTPLFDENKSLVEQNTKLINSNRDLNAMIVHLISQNKKIMEQTIQMDKKTMLNLINDLENDEMNNSTAKITIRRIDAKKIV
jgi:uncharacterized protein YbcC (UPF0753/DUF2309 family)